MVGRHNMPPKICVYKEHWSGIGGTYEYALKRMVYIYPVASFLRGIHQKETEHLLGEYTTYLFL